MRLPFVARLTARPAERLAETPPAAEVSRRTVFAGAGAVGAAAAAVALVPGVRPAVDVAAAAGPADAEAGDEGYRLTAHVAHYYRTARV